MPALRNRGRVGLTKRRHKKQKEDLKRMKAAPFGPPSNLVHSRFTLTRSDHIHGACQKNRAQTLRMQYLFSCLPATYSAIEGTLSPARLGRYLQPARGDKHLALRLYIWNAHLCEALYLPMQFAEVSARNAIHVPVVRRFGQSWYLEPRFINLLPDRMKTEISETVRKERTRRGASLDENHIVAGLSFGFWVSLMTSAYNNHLWLNGVKQSFPNAGSGDTRETIYKRLDEMRRFRNDIAHHVAIFDRGPQRQFQNALYITKLVCDETHWLAAQLAKVGRVINERPKN